MTSALRGFFAVAENYPELKANNNFQQLQKRITELESQIADRREFYNDSVNTFNIRIQQIPDTFVAAFMNLKAARDVQGAGRGKGRRSNEVRRRSIRKVIKALRFQGFKKFSLCSHQHKLETSL